MGERLATKVHIRHPAMRFKSGIFVPVDNTKVQVIVCMLQLLIRHSQLGNSLSGSIWQHKTYPSPRPLAPPWVSELLAVELKFPDDNAKMLVINDSYLPIAVILITGKT